MVQGRQRYGLEVSLSGYHDKLPSLLDTVSFKLSPP